jgi:copper(I)-binding protein
MALAIGLAAPALAAEVEVSGGWFRALPAGLPAGGYFTLRNTGNDAAVLTGASSSACGMVMLHKSVEKGGMSRMVHVDSVTVPAHGAVAFKPGGYHLMCMKPKPAMTPGARIAVTLEFADGTRTDARFVVKNANGD